MADDKKPWWRSVTVWALVVQLVGLILLGVSRGDGALQIITDEGVQATVGALVVALGSAGILWGRVRATRSVTLQSPFKVTRTRRPRKKT